MLNTGTAKVVISAEDKTGAAFASAQRSMQVFFAGANTGFASLTGGASRFAGMAGGIFGVASALNAVKQAFSFADSINDVAKANDVAVGSVLNLANALQQNGGEAQNATKIYSAFSGAVDTAASGSEEAQRKFASLNVTLTDLKQLDNQALFEKTLAGLSAIEDPIRRNALQADLLGKALKGVDVQGLADDFTKNEGAFDGAAEGYTKIASAMDRIDAISFRLKDSLAQRFGPWFESITSYVAKALIGWDTLADKIKKAANAGVPSAFKAAPKIGDKPVLGAFNLPKEYQSTQNVREVVDKAGENAAEKLKRERERAAEKAKQDGERRVQEAERARKAFIDKQNQFDDLARGFERRIDASENKRLDARAELRKKLEEEYTELAIKQAEKIHDSENKLLDERQKKAADLLQDQAEKQQKLADDLSQAFTNGLFDSFKEGESFGKAMLRNLLAFAKTYGANLLQQIFSPIANNITGILGNAVKSLVGGGGASLFSGAANASTGGAGGISNILGQLKTGISSFTNGTSFLTSGIEKLGVLLSNGNGRILDTLGGFLGGNAGAISGALPYAGAALQLLQGNIKGAAFTAAGAAIGSFIPGIGTAIGAALGGALGGIFGKKKIPRFSSQVLTTFNDGVFNTKNGAQIYKPLGAESSLSELAKQFSTSLGGFLKGFGLDDNVSTKVDLLKKRKKSYGIFEAAFDGQTIVGSTTGKAKNVQDTFNRLIETVLGDTLAKAIQKSSVVKGITGLFEGLTDKAVVLSLITATTALNAQSAELTKQFNLSVDAAGRVVQASGAAGQGLADFANKLALVAQSSQTVGDVLVKSRADLSAELGKVYGDIVQEAITSTVTKKVPVANTASSLFGTGAGGFNLFGNVTQQFKTVTEQVTTYVDKLISKSIELPASLADYDALLKSINTSTEGGAKQFADIFKLRDSAAALFASQDALKGGVANATFDLRSPAAQRKIREDELNALLGRLGVGKPTGLDGYLKLADGLDVTTKAGADLAAAFPTLIDLFKQLTGGVNDLGGAISTSRITEDFVQLADQRRYEAVARNYGTEFASDYTSNVEAGRIKNGKSGSGNTDTALLEEIKALRKDFQVMAIDQTKLLKYQAKIDEIGIKVAA